MTLIHRLIAAMRGNPAAPDGFRLFAYALGAFACAHYLVYTFQYFAPVVATTYLVPLFGVLVMLFPSSGVWFGALAATLLIDGVLHVPVGSNHTMMTNILALALAISGGRHLFSGQGLAGWYRDAAPVGRWLLIIMYAYGIFHKINTDFLNPASSCAVTLMEQMYLLNHLADQRWFQTMGIYGTFAIEGAVMVCLLVRRLNYAGVVVGMLFHVMLSLSAYALYPGFSALSLALHTLFLPESTLAAFRRSRIGTLLGARISLPLHASWLALFFVLSYYFGYQLRYGPMSLVWIAFLAAPVTLIAVVGGHEPAAERTTPRPYHFRSALWVLNLLPVLFFLNGLSPYAGLKTRQSINMFANLRVEGGVSNHLVFSRPLPLFDYTRELVTITDPGALPYFGYIRDNGLRLVYYEFLNILERNRNITVSYEKDGVRYEQQSYATLKNEIDRTLHPRWVRAFIHFTPVDLTTPKPCGPDR